MKRAFGVKAVKMRMRLFYEEGVNRMRKAAGR